MYFLFPQNALFFFCFKILEGDPYFPPAPKFPKLYVFRNSPSWYKHQHPLFTSTRDTSAIYTNKQGLLRPSNSDCSKYLFLPYSAPHTMYWLNNSSSLSSYKLSLPDPENIWEVCTVQKGDLLRDKLTKYYHSDIQEGHHFPLQWRQFFKVCLKSYPFI